MTPWRAATANPVEDMQANLALRYGTPLPYGQQHLEPETVAQARAALSDPLGLGANVAQGVTLHGAGLLFPGLKQRAASYSGMHPTAGALGETAGGFAPGLITGGLADLAAATPALATRPLVRAFVRYAPSFLLGGGQGYVNTPADAPPGAEWINAGVGGLTGLGGQAMTDMGGNVVNRIETGRMPSWKPVVTPIAKGALKTGLVSGTGYGLHELSRFLGIPLGAEASPLALLLSPEIRHAVFGGPEQMWGGARNLASNLYGALSTPSGPARVGGRFAAGAFPPGRSAIPGALAAPYLAGQTTPSALAQWYAEHYYDPNKPSVPNF